MAGNHPAPTRTNFIQLKHQLEFATQGYDLLDQKRNILILELLNLVDQAVDFEDRSDCMLKDAHTSLRRAVLDGGKLKVADLASSINIESKITITQRRVMGVALPVVNTEFSEHGPYYSPNETSPWIDEAINDFKQVLNLMGELAELKISIMRLSREVRKTIRKVNALEKIAIPNLTDSIRYIQNRLEEDERDRYILMKRVKARLSRREEQL
ncbi:MAG: V-type ATP synthase subunit D [Spirochaetes bacterium]|jgi:V/A-type H+-transporting ATPase subunit D|nr:V-type ATP synthase subunit D [Spirochaetota bacterium]